MMKAQDYKSKAAKDKVNHMTSDSNALSDFFYTTESNNTRFDYRDERGPNYGDPYTDRYNTRTSVESLDVDTSATSYSERNPRRASPRSKSEKIYSRKYSNSPRQRIQSPNRYHVETRRGSSPKNRYSLESASEQTLRYRSRASRKRDDSYMYDDFSYEKYFEPAESRTRERSLSRSEKRRRMRERAEQEAKDKIRRPSPKQEREYQVYAYQDDKPHDRVFMRGTKDRRRSPLPSEIELKTHEYPVLGFKDRNTIDANDSDMVYVPVLVIDNSNKLKNKPAPAVKQNPGPQGNFQVYAANLQNKNVFETMGDTNYKKTSSGSQNRPSFIEQNPSLNQHSYLNPQSLVDFDSIFNQNVYSSMPVDRKISREIKATRSPPFGNNQQSIIYNVNVDAAPEVESDSKRMSQTRRPTKDNLHDDYPVTKDYIKVNDGEERKSFVTPTRQSIKPEDRNPSVFIDVITSEKISHSISDSKDAPRHKSFVKGSFITRNPIVPEDNSPRRSVNAGNHNTLESPKRSRVEAKYGSLAIPSDIPREDGAEIRNTQGMTRLSQIEGAEKLSPTRNSTKEFTVRQSTASPMPRKSTVSHPSPTVATAKQPSISEARASQIAEKKLSAIQTRPSLAVPQDRSSTPIVEMIPESRKSLAKPPQVTQTPTEATLKELRKSVQSQEEVKAGLVEQRKSNVSAGPEMTTQQHKRPSRSPTSSQQGEESKEALREFTAVVFQEDYVKDPSPMNTYSDQNAEASVRKSEVKAKDHSLTDENAKHADLRKSQPLDEVQNEPRVLSEERVTSVVHFSQVLKDNNAPSSKPLYDAPNNEETTRSLRDQPSLKGTPREDENSAPVAQPSVRSQEPKQVEGKKSTVKKPALKKSESKVAKKSESQIPKKSESKVQKKGLASKLFKSKSQSSHEGMGDTRTKSVVSKSSKQSVAKENKTDKKRSVAKSIFGVLKRSKSNISNKSSAPTQEEPPAEVREEGRQERQEKIEAKEKKPEEHPCECLTGYVRQARECGHFFLGTTLYEHVMKTLEIIW